MSYQVLARKWRPQSFAEMVGQEAVLTALSNGLAMGRIHHAYLFSGTRGVGKTSIARLLAKGLNCETGITAKPCRRCDSCQAIERGNFVDLIEIDAASRTKVEDTRELLDNVQYAPAHGRFKVYLIDEVHMLSRHSFNALLKTLEEPPAHVKFLLATTDPQKLPVTILSRCLQFHLKALDTTQISEQLKKILQAEQVDSEPRALHLLARAAEGSMRDALSLTDQAIAMGEGEVTTSVVTRMLGLLDDEQPLALLEALADADPVKVMEGIGEAATHGVDWERLLIEMMALLQRTAMLQLLPMKESEEISQQEQRLYLLARNVAPQDVQLYYQILLIGRKELAYAPDYRMGVEMALLRALAFHPKREQISSSTAVLAEEKLLSPSAPSMPVQQQAAENNERAEKPLPDATAELLQARMMLRRQQDPPPTKKSEPTASALMPSVPSALQRLTAIDRKKSKEPKIATVPSERIPGEAKQETYRWQSRGTVKDNPVIKGATPTALRQAVEEERSTELSAKLAAEARQRDDWAAELNEMALPKLVEQLALNTAKEEKSAKEICLHVRSAHRHLNTVSAQQVLTEAFEKRLGHQVELTIIADDNPALCTPMEWRNLIYAEKLAQARQSIMTDNNIQRLCQIFDADLDEESIRPV